MKTAQIHQKQNEQKGRKAVESRLTAPKRGSRRRVGLGRLRRTGEEERRERPSARDLHDQQHHVHRMP